MSRTNLRVRPATADDVPALVEITRAHEALATVTPGRAGADDQRAVRLAAILDDPSRVLLVAADDAGTVAGLLLARHDATGAIDLTPVLHVTHLLVLPGQRRKGVGRLLLAAAVHLADEAATEHVMVSVAAGSREGNRYLARLGFAPLITHRIAATSTLRRSLGMTDVAGRMAALRRARLARAQRSGFSGRAVGRGA